MNGNYTYSGKHTAASKRPGAAAPRRGGKRGLLLLCLALVLCFAIGGTVAYLVDNTTAVKNEFKPTENTGDIPEELVENIKKNVTVRNTGEDVATYVRVKLLSSMVDKDGNQLAVASSVPEFTPGEGWVEYEGYYYYTDPLPVGGTSEPLIGETGIKLEGTDDGDHQIIDVLAQYVQAEGETEAGVPAVADAWGVTISEGTVTPYPPQSN